jgi:hypothetical protein
MSPKLAATLIAAWGLAAFSQSARADSYFPTSTTINYAVSGSAYVGQDGTGGNSSPTVDLVTGGSTQDGLYLYNSSLLNMSGGIVGSNTSGGNRNIEVSDNASVNLSGGTVGSTIDFDSTGTLNFSGGVVGVTINAIGGTVNMTGGSAANVGLSDIFNLQGGTIGSVDAEGGTLNVYGSGLYDTVEAGRSPTYFLYGTLEDGTILNGLEVDTTGGETTTINLFNPTAVPEPSSLVLAVVGALAGLGSVGYRRRGEWSPRVSTLIRRIAKRH